MISTLGDMSRLIEPTTRPVPLLVVWNLNRVDRTSGNESAAIVPRFAGDVHDAPFVDVDTVTTPVEDMAYFTKIGDAPVIR